MARKFKDDFRESPKADDSLTASVRHVRDELLSIIEKENLESIECRWVRTADRMPDIPGDEKSWAHVSVIAAKRGRKKSSPMIYERAVIRGKTVYRWKYVWDKIYDGNDIFAWMPYPEAPKEEENE